MPETYLKVQESADLNQYKKPNTKIYVNDSLVLEGPTQKFHDISHFLAKKILGEYQKLAPQKFAEFVAKTRINLENCGNFSSLGEAVPEVFDRFLRTGRGSELSLEREITENDNLDLPAGTYLVIPSENIGRLFDEFYSMRQAWSIHSNLKVSPWKNVFKK